MKVKVFKQNKNRFWCGFKPYEYINGEIKPLAGHKEQKEVEAVKKYIEENKDKTEIKLSLF